MTSKVRQGMPAPHLGKDVFRLRFFNQFYDPAFPKSELERACEVAWRIYRDANKAPRTQPAGAEFADPTTTFRWNGLPHAMPSKRPRSSIVMPRYLRAFC
jgi:hypothetical protein